MTKRKKKKEDRSWLYLLLIIILLLLVIFLFMNKSAIFDYKTNYNSPGLNSGDLDGTDDSDSSSNNGGSGTSGSDDPTLQQTFTGGGKITEGEPCVTIPINSDYDDPYIFFSYSMDIQENIMFDCSECFVRWTIYDGPKFIKTIIQTEAAGQTYIYNYEGGDIEICVDTDCPCEITVSWTLKIYD